ncbi:hypothetical protein VZT92_025777 [Zoarces viviparus]|uniref:Protein pitchfork n=1 Tax=Zoarces viviparus TaxID=48416 RepID=A0AAW1DY38_ZOAVI
MFPVQRVVFGTTQERKFFPVNFAPDRMGIQMSREETPNIGPGCYDNDKFGTIVYDLQKTPGSKKGYSLSARTATRFTPCSTETATPSPQQYQQDQSRSRVPPLGKTPFNSTTQRFKSKSCTVEDIPGPGTYAHDAVTNRKVSWPMCFGAPDWSRLPQMKNISVKGKLNSEEAFQKHRSRLAYMSLYY